MTVVARPWRVALAMASWAMRKRWTARMLSGTPTGSGHRNVQAIPVRWAVLRASSSRASSRPPSSRSTGRKAARHLAHAAQGVLHETRDFPGGVRAVVRLAGEVLLEQVGGEADGGEVLAHAVVQVAPDALAFALADGNDLVLQTLGAFEQFDAGAHGVAVLLKDRACKSDEAEEHQRTVPSQ